MRHYALMITLLLGSVSWARAESGKSPVASSGVVFTGETVSSFASGVSVPAGRSYFYTSGITASVIKKDATNVYERIGDTYVQSLSCLKNIEAILAKQGLSLKDVVFLRVFLAPDAIKGGRQDFPAWFRAYGEHFNNQDNPGKTARTTIGVAALVSPDALIEIEAVAVYPEKK